MGIFLKELNIAQILEHDAFKIWKNLEVGTKVYLRKGEGVDSGKILVYLPNAGNEVVLGVLPKDEVTPIDKFANANWPIEVMFDCVICRKDENIGKYDQKLHVLIQIKQINEYEYTLIKGNLKEEEEAANEREEEK